MDGVPVGPATNIVSATYGWFDRLRVKVANLALLVFSCGSAISAAVQRLTEPSQGTQRLIELDIGEIFAAAAVASVVLKECRARPALTRADHAILNACALTWFLPEGHAVYAGMTLAGGWLVIQRSHDRVLTDVGQIWLALTLCELWSKLGFKLLYHFIEPAEVAFIAWVGRFAFPRLHASGAYLSSSSDWSIVMLEGCSSFHNLSLAALLWLCVLKIVGWQVSRGAVGALAVSAGLVLTINVARILAMLPSREAYIFWHDSTGSIAVVLATVAASVLPIVIYVEKAPHPVPARA